MLSSLGGLPKFHISLAIKSTDCTADWHDEALRPVTMVLVSSEAEIMGAFISKRLLHHVKSCGLGRGITGKMRDEERKIEFSTFKISICI